MLVLSVCLVNALPPAADLRAAYAERGLAPKSQGGRGCCSLFALVGVLEFELSRPGAPVRLSEEYLNWASHRASGRATDGSFFSHALDGLAQAGLCRAELMPYAERYDPAAEPSAIARDEAAARRDARADWIKTWDVTTGLSDAQLTAIRAAVAAGHPVAVGLRWPKQASYDAEHRLAMPPPEEVFDGHSIVIVGYRDAAEQPGGGEFWFRNSSGPDWQAAGYARFSYAYVAAYGNDAVCVTPARPAP